LQSISRTPKAPAAFHLRFYQIHSCGHLIPRSAFEYSASLEEKQDFCTQTLISNISDPPLTSGRAADLEAPFALADHFIAQISKIDNYR
jgi:hypothetical protein